MSIEQDYDHEIDSYSRETFKRNTRESSSSKRTAPQSRRRKSPQSVNGLHKRRRRKMTW